MRRTCFFLLMLVSCLWISACNRIPVISSPSATPYIVETPPRLTPVGIEIESNPTMTIPAISPTREVIPVLQLTYIISEFDSNILRFYAITLDCPERYPPCLGEPELLFEVDSELRGWQLTEHSWSPDGEYVAFTANLDGMRSDLYIADSRGESITKITGELDGASVLPDWSPIDDEIVFFFCPYENCGIRSIDSKGVSRSPIFISGSYPAWSPDGTRLAYIYYRNIQGTFQVYTADLETLTITQLTYSKTDNFSPDYSPDGNTIVFTRYLRKDRWDQGIDPNLIILDVESGTEVQLTSELESQYYHPTWSPTGDMIAFVKWVLERDVDIHIIRPDGSSMINVTNSPEIRESDPAWRLSTK